MKTVLRSVASELLRAVVQHAPSSSRSWGNAMLTEMDFIQSDRAAFQWALGSATSIFRYSIHHTVSASPLLRAIGRSVGGLALSALFCAGVVAACVFGLTRVSPFLFPDAQLVHMRWVQWISVLGLPEIIFVVTAVGLWRTRKILSSGILACAITLATHFLMYVSHHS